MSSLAKDLMITHIGITPQTVEVGATVLVSIGVSEVNLEWLDWASTIWANVESLTWGA